MFLRSLKMLEFPSAEEGGYKVWAVEKSDLCCRGMDGRTDYIHQCWDLLRVPLLGAF